MARYFRCITCLVIVLAAFMALPVTAQDDQPVQILFMHHSTGQGLIWQGGVREAFTELGYEFWDHGYNDEGLIDPAGNYLGVNWDVPGDNTDPDGWYAIFNQLVTDPPDNTLSHMLQADVILFKSCFPASNISDEATLDQYKDYYLSIRDVMDQHPDKLFIPFTPPPLVPNETAPENAARAQAWATYLVSDEYGAGHPNVMVFDFFSLLADANGYLRVEYRGDEWDSHPNETANTAIGPELVAFVDQAIRDFVPGEVTADTGSAESDVSLQDAALFGFEDPLAFEWWWEYTNEPVNTFACDLESTAHRGSYALRLAFEIPAEGNAGCGADFETTSGWAAAQGISFYWRADTPGLSMVFALGVKDQQDTEATPFEVELRTGGDDWTQVVVLWDDLAVPEWFGDASMTTFDPDRVAWIAFDVGEWASAQAGAIWIDDVALVTTQP